MRSSRSVPRRVYSACGQTWVVLDRDRQESLVRCPHVQSVVLRKRSRDAYTTTDGNRDATRELPAGVTRHSKTSHFWALSALALSFVPRAYQRSFGRSTFRGLRGLCARLPGPSATEQALGYCLKMAVGPAQVFKESIDDPRPAWCHENLNFGPAGWDDSRHRAVSCGDLPGKT